MSKPLARELKAAGWVKSSIGPGWSKNGAYYASLTSGSIVGQFEKDHREFAFQIHLPQAMPKEVVLYLINAAAASRNTLEASRGEA